MVPGDLVSETPAEKPSVDVPIKGRYITLEKLNESHMADLWHDMGVDEATWKWLPGNAPKTQEEFATEFMGLVEAGNIGFAVMGDPDRLNPMPESHSIDSGRRREALGLMFYGADVSLNHRTIEAGAILGPRIRQTVPSTEAHYVLLKNVFNPQTGPPYRRVSWKTSSFNVASQRAAQRLGYVYEGTWRNHMIVDGQSRDTVWLSMIDDDWPVIREALEQWLDSQNFDGDGKQIRKLEEIRRSLK